MTSFEDLAAVTYFESICIKSSSVKALEFIAGFVSSSRFLDLKLQDEKRKQAKTRIEEIEKAATVSKLAVLTVYQLEKKLGELYKLPKDDATMLSIQVCIYLYSAKQLERTRVFKEYKKKHAEYIHIKHVEYIRKLDNPGSTDEQPKITNPNEEYRPILEKLGFDYFHKTESFVDIYPCNAGLMTLSRTAGHF